MSPTSSLLIRGVFTLGVAQVFSWIASSVTVVLLPRFLGDVNLGKLSYASAFTFLVGLLADLGAATYVTKETARRPEHAASFVTNALAMRIPFSVLAAALAVVIVNIAGQDAITKQLVYILSAGILLTSCSTLVLASLQGLSAMKGIGASTALSKLVYAGLVAGALFAGGNVIEVAVVADIGVAVGMIVATIALVKRLRPKLRVDWTTAKLVLIGGLPFFVWQAALVVYGQIDTVLLSFLSGDAAVGWYAAAYRLVLIPGFVPSIIMTVVFPTLSANTANPGVFNAIARRAMHVVTIACVPLACGLMMLPDKLVQFLGYGDSFTRSAAPLMLLAPHIALVGIDMIIGVVLVTRDLQRQWAIAGIAAAFLNTGLNLVAIPLTQSAYGNGAIGSAVVTTLTEIFMLVVGLRLLPSGVFDRATLVTVCKCGIAGGVMSAVDLFARDVPLPALVPLSAMVYVLACFALGILRQGDVAQLWTYLVRSRAARTLPVEAM